MKEICVMNHEKTFNLNVSVESLISVALTLIKVQETLIQVSETLIHVPPVLIRTPELPVQLQLKILTTTLSGS